MLKDHKDEAPSGIKFTYSNGLLYYTGGEHSQLVIAKDLLTKVLRLAHDVNSHVGLRHCYQRLTHSVYIHRLVHDLEVYLRHCPTCQVNQTKRHRP